MSNSDFAHLKLVLEQTKGDTTPTNHQKKLNTLPRLNWQKKMCLNQSPTYVQSGQTWKPVHVLRHTPINVSVSLFKDPQNGGVPICHQPRLLLAHGLRGLGQKTWVCGSKNRSTGCQDFGFASEQRSHLRSLETLKYGHVELQTNRSPRRKNLPAPSGRILRPTASRPAESLFKKSNWNPPEGCLAQNPATKYLIS